MTSDQPPTTPAEAGPAGGAVSEQRVSPDDMKPTIEADFRAWMLRFRQTTGRPLTDAEHALAKVAHASGFLAGFQTGADVMRQEINAREEAE